MNSDTTPRRIIRLPEVCKAVGLSRSGIYARIQKGAFPAPIKMGYSSGWIESEVQGWIEQQIARRRSVP
ncbi:helix-turn-helix transcriptional regulator [Cupriavidus basilensis]|uniref:helix-turn-helix transcriptional regulator n=1 Tax=Cupriavidus basilensis TaxID=68895 RepID=UPI00157B4DAA|nr:AlpA family transcriptional regulator [Cupriavidus basilensis]NUA26138.1 AlpA family transcriptional regulator [Cupriavidus basilensis]